MMDIGYTKDIVVCPYCMYKHEDYQNFTSLDEEEADFSLECENPDCGKEFHVKIKVVTWFKTDKL